jgi:hypothetical protein
MDRVSTDGVAEPCLMCGKPMWEPDPPTWFEGGRSGSLSLLVRPLTADQILRVSLCDWCLARARAQGRVRLITRNHHSGQSVNTVWRRG